MRRAYGIAVISFWVIMMGLLFQKEVLPAFIITSPSGYEISLTKDRPVRESWMGIYFKDKKIGFSNTVMSQDVDDGIAGYRINETTLLRFNMLGEQRFVRLRGSSFFNEEYMLKGFDYKLVSAEVSGMTRSATGKGLGGANRHRFDVSAKVEGDDLNLVIDTGADKKEMSFKIRPHTLISNSISPLLLFKNLDVKKEINFEIFDPVSFGMNRVSIKSVGQEVMELNNREYAARVFETDVSGVKTRTWMGEDGDILKEESALGFTMYKENPKDALDMAHSLSFEAQDLVSGFSLSSEKKISDPRGVSYLEIDKNGIVVEIFKDREPSWKHPLPAPGEVTFEDKDPFVQADEERIVNLAREIVGNERDSWLAARRILHWVYDNIEKTPTLSIPSSLDVLRTMQGDCNEHTVLFTALARSIGLPTRMMAGLVYLDNAFYYHAWPKVYVGEWVNMDPTLGQEIADATHIPLLEGGLKEQLELIKIIGELKIEVVEYK